MRTITGTLLKQALTTSLCAALAVGGMLPASAREHRERVVVHRQTVRQAPVRTMQRPRIVRAAPRASFVRTAPRRRTIVRSAPRQRFLRTAPRATVIRTAPRERFIRTAPRTRIVRTAPREHFVRAAPRTTFVRTAPRRHIVRTAPFVQYVRVAPRRILQRRRYVTTREIVRSPLMRSVVAPRVRTAIAYHPAYLAGRVVSVARDRIILAPPVGQRIVVRDVAVANPSAFVPLGTYVTLPVRYANGYYSVYTQPTYNGYAYAPPAYCYGPSSTLYAALLPAVIGALTGNRNSFNTSDLATLALTAAAGSNSCSAYGPAYAAPVTYAPPAAYSVTPYTVAPYSVSPYGYSNAYPTPYDNCVWSDMDNDGDGGCVAPQQTAYSYTPYAAYAPQQVQGLVVAKTGSMLMVLGANGMQPIFVNAAPALQNGYALNGPVAVGQIVDAIGYYNGDQFIATALE